MGGFRIFLILLVAYSVESHPAYSKQNGRGNGHGHAHDNHQDNDRGHGKDKKKKKRPGHGHSKGKTIRIDRPRPGDRYDEIALKVITRHIRKRDCEDIGNALREISNSVLTGNEDDLDLSDLDLGRRHWRKKAKKFRKVQAEPEFWRSLWDRVAQIYRDCDFECFENGEAIGELSGTAYCAVSQAIGGLPGPGQIIQPPLELCENSIFTGCQSGYRVAASEVEGCSEYATGDFQKVFREFIGQDCHVDPESD